MRKIIFICHGNICRSPAAEFIAKEFIRKNHLEHHFEIISRAVSTEEIGNDIYPPMKSALRKAGIPYFYHYAKQITKEDYDWADDIYYMDQSNYKYLSWMFDDRDNKIKPIFILNPGITAIEDPWYTGRFEFVVKQINDCVNTILKV